MAIEKIVNNSQLLALILRKDFSQPGLHFFTSLEYSQQLAYMRYPTGKVIQPHVHNPVHREVIYTQIGPRGLVLAFIQNLAFLRKSP